MQNQEQIIGRAHVDPSNSNSRAIGDVLAMQLASITYCSLKGPNVVSKTLKKHLPQMRLVWEPTGTIQGEYAFIALYGDQYIIAIRGSIINFSWGSFDNWFKQDFNIFEQVSWLYTNDHTANPMISKGANEGINNLNKLVDINGETILSFLKKYAFPYGKFLAVTGHSLGANLATVYAPYLRYQLLESRYQLPGIFSVLTFAAPCSWNQAFAKQFDTNFTNSWRYYNVIDVVPYSATKIREIGQLYPAPAPNAANISVTYDGVTVTLSKVCGLIADALDVTEVAYNSWYTEVNQKRGAVALNTGKTIYSVKGIIPVEQFFEQIGQQHDHNHYLSWLGAAALQCEL
jgi:hypothetical protein